MQPGSSFPDRHSFLLQVCSNASVNAIFNKSTILPSRILAIYKIKNIFIKLHLMPNLYNILFNIGQKFFNVSRYCKVSLYILFLSLASFGQGQFKSPCLYIFQWSHLTFVCVTQLGKGYPVRQFAVWMNL